MEEKVKARVIRRGGDSPILDSKKRMPNHLAGRAGIALVEFQLGRRGMEFIQTYQHSECGDIWVETSVGRLSIEVKTTAKGGSWFVKKNQTISEFFVLTNLESAICWVVSREELASIVKLSTQAWPGYIL